MVIMPSSQFMPDAVTTTPTQHGSFKKMDVKVTDAGRQVQSTGQVPEKVPLSGRVVHSFKSILNNIRMSLMKAGQVGLAPGPLVFFGIGLAAIAPSVVTCGLLGGLIQKIKHLAGYDSYAFMGGLYIGLYAVVAIAAPAAIITSFAAALALFCVIAPVSTLLQIPKFIQQAATMSNEDLNKLHVEADKDWSEFKEDIIGIADGLRNFLT